MTTLSHILHRDCWIWSKAKGSWGYASRRIKGKTFNVYSEVYKEVFGELPEGFELHHVCKVRACINPFHVVSVPQYLHRKKEGRLPSGLTISYPATKLPVGEVRRRRSEAASRRHAYEKWEKGWGK